jgi:hypothetical protein
VRLIAALAAWIAAATKGEQSVEAGLDPAPKPDG